MRRKNDKSKIKRGYGTGHGSNYKPYIHTAEFNSLGTCANPIDWKTGRTIQLLSQGEKYFWYLMRWQDDVVDIREQYPLPINETIKIADAYRIKHPRYRNQLAVMTSDFLIDFDNGTQAVYSIKNSKTEVSQSNRTLEKLFIEKKYWESLGVPYHLVFKEDLNIVYAENIRQAVQYYCAEDVFDRISMIKYLIAHKMLLIETLMQTQRVDFKKLTEVYKESVICSKLTKG